MANLPNDGSENTNQPQRASVRFSLIQAEPDESAFRLMVATCLVLAICVAGCGKEKATPPQATIAGADDHASVAAADDNAASDRASEPTAEKEAAAPVVAEEPGAEIASAPEVEEPQAPPSETPVAAAPAPSTVEAAAAPVSAPSPPPGDQVAANAAQPAAGGTKKPAPPKPSTARPKPAGGAAAPAPVATEVHKPAVILSQDHAKASLVGVGDKFPALSLPDLEGAAQELSQLYGDRMTIVVFWTAKEMYAREQFSRIMAECEARYGKQGVKVVAVNVGDAPDAVKELATKYGVTIPCLTDADGAGFAKVAAGLLPRTYLLDAGGQILWFDLEYSRSERLELHNAILFQLKAGGA